MKASRCLHPEKRKKTNCCCVLCVGACEIARATPQRERGGDTAAFRCFATNTKMSGALLLLPPRVCESIPACLNSGYGTQLNYTPNVPPHRRRSQRKKKKAAALTLSSLRDREGGAAAPSPGRRLPFRSCRTQGNCIEFRSNWQTNAQLLRYVFHAKLDEQKN